MAHSPPSSYDLALKRIYELESQQVPAIASQLTQQQLQVLLAHPRKSSFSSAARRDSQLRMSAGGGGGGGEPAGSSSRQQPQQWDMSSVASGDLSPRAADIDEDLLRRVNDLVLENAELDRVRQRTEEAANEAIKAYNALWAHCSSADRIDFLRASCDLPKQVIPAEYQHLSQVELVPTLIDDVEQQRAVVFQLDRRVTELLTQIEDVSRELHKAREAHLLADELLDQQALGYEAKMLKLDSVLDSNDNLLLENGQLSEAVAVHQHIADLATRAAKDKEVERSHAQADLDAARTAHAQTIRNLEEEREKNRALAAEREVLRRQLEAANKKLVESERRWAELAQSSIDEAAEARTAQALQRQWHEMFRTTLQPGGGAAPQRPHNKALHNNTNSKAVGGGNSSSLAATTTGLGNSNKLQFSTSGGGGGRLVSGSPALLASQSSHNLALISSTSLMGPAAASPASAQPAPAAAAPPQAVGTSSGHFATTESSSHNSGSNYQHQTATEQPIVNSASGGNMMLPPASVHHATPQARETSLEQQQQPHYLTDSRSQSAAAKLPCTHPVPPGRVIKGAAPGRPAAPALATLALLTKPVRPNVRLHNKSILEKALMTRGEQARQTQLQEQLAKTKKRGNVPPPPTLSEIAF